MSKDNNKNIENKSDFDFSFLIPLLVEHKLSKEFKHLPKYEYFLSLILKDQKAPGALVKISNRLLKKVIRQEIITRIKNNLLTFGLIECNYKKRFELVKGQSIGTEPYSYKVTDLYYQLTQSNIGAYFNGYGFIQMPQVPNLTTQYIKSAIMYNGYGFTDEKLNSLRVKFQDKVNRAINGRWYDLVNLPLKPEYKFVRDNALKLEIDLGAYQFINEQLNNKVKLKWVKSEFIDKGKLVVYLNKNRVFNEEIASQWRNHVEKIERGNYQFSCPASVNRVYYNITSMPAELRKYLKYKGQELYYLDYSNFQPFLFNKVLVEKFGNEKPADVLNYIELTSEGRFYSEIKKLIESADDIEIKDPLNFKVDFFGKVFFSSEKVNYKYRKVFAQHFPNVSACITESKKDNYKALAIELQKLESEIVINTILREIAQSKPDSFVLPIHDAVICEKQLFSYVKDLMLYKAEQVIGYKPTLKYELLTPKIN